MTEASDSKMSNPEFSRPIEAESLLHGLSTQTLKATTAECDALKERLGIDALHHLSATLNFKRNSSGQRMKVRVDGHFKAEISQTCVVTLEPFTSKIEGTIETLYDASAAQQDDNQDLDVDLQDSDPPEPLIDGIIDLGELVAQSLSLEIDSHPRKPGAEADLTLVEQLNRGHMEDDVKSTHPFAALQNLKIEPKD